MGQDSAIQWTHHTFNPWRGCSKVHAGCTNCYAEKNIGVKMHGITWGEVWQGGQRVVKAESGWGEPLKWVRDAARAGERRRVFCASLADVLEVPAYPPNGIAGLPDRVAMLDRVDMTRSALDAARARLWDVIRETAAVMAPDGTPREVVDHDKALRSWPGLDWLLLTKRPENWHLVPKDVRPLVWLGTSISDQKTADEWVPRLLDAQGFRLRFLSVEPLVGPVDLTAIPGEIGFGLHSRDVLRGWNIHHDDDDRYTVEPWKKVDWVIVGGESGPKARPCNVEWVRDIVRQCREAGVPCSVKQLGSEYVDEKNGVAGAGLRVPREAAPLVSRRLIDPKGGDVSEWPDDIRVREFPLFA